MPRLRIAALCLLAWPCSVLAATAPEDMLEEVTVTGEQPGPAMWRVSRGAHTLWIMGTLSPLPAKMTWRSRQAEAVISASGEILASSTESLHIGNTFTVLRYVPALLRLRHNANGATLREVLPPPLYDRWQAAHRRWFGADPDAKERARPLYAAELLFQQALQGSGLVRRDAVWPQVRKLARRHDVHIRQREFATQLQDPKSLIADLAALPRDKEAACLAATLDHIERDLPDMRRRAEAWASGDIAALRSLPPRTTTRTCLDAIMEKPRLRELISAQREKIEADWSGIVDWMLLTHGSSFTTLPIENLLDPDGVVSTLRGKGYVVDEPR